MILLVDITKEQKKALLIIYPSIRQFANKMIANTADRIISENEQFNIDSALRERHDREVLNDYDPHKRKMTQATKDKISKGLKATSKRQGWKGMRLLPETIEKLKLNHKGMKGLKHSEETKQKMSLARRGMKYKKYKGKEESLSN